MIIEFYYLGTDHKKVGVIYNEGVGVLAAIAKEKNCQTSLRMFNLADFRKGFNIRENINIHAISFPSQQFSLAMQLINKIKLEDKGNGLIVVGGVHATVDRQSVIALENVDVVVSGEGEEAMKWIIDNYDLIKTHPDKCNIPNSYIKGAPIKPLQKAGYVDLDTSPYPLRSIFNKKLLKRSPEFILSRGCPFSCAYCANEFYNKTFGMKIRKKSPEYCIGELEDSFSVLGIYKDTMLTFHDDVFLLDVNWLQSFSKLYKKNFNNPFRCNTTASYVTDENIKLLEEMNCSEVWVGVETGNEEYRNTVLNKKVSNKQIVKAFDTINRHGLKGISFNMLGGPGETVEQLKDTIKLNRECKVYRSTNAIFVPFPGTTLYENELRKDNIREFTEDETCEGVSLSGLKRKNVDDKDYFYWRQMLEFSVDNKKILYYLALCLKYLSVPPKFLVKLEFIKHFFRNRSIINRYDEE